MNRKAKVKKYERVEFQFLSLDEAETENGTVLIRDDQMVIDIQDTDGATVYLITGSASEHLFVGGNSAGQHMPRVQATWVKLNRKYVGDWVEDGYEYLFSFELTQERLEQ
jgi:hypothetical protein